ncbi:MAG: manganese efflux pump MntP family protein [Oscillospiraceae bacterium]|nr:manganese efflux pump MntP family protein [Oscillospiraceae bacterium]
MNLFVLIALAVGLSMDAFAVSICLGLSTAKTTLRKALIAGLYFGVFQAVMPLIGFFVASRFADIIIAYDHWIAFALLSFLGGKMIFGSLSSEEQAEKENSLRPKQMLPLAIATSIDALAVGVSFAFLHVDIVLAVLLIGITTFLVSMAGVKIGSVFGTRFKSKAELVGGVILVLTGVNILLDHLGVYDGW